MPVGGRMGGKAGIANGYATQGEQAKKKRNIIKIVK